MSINQLLQRSSGNISVRVYVCAWSEHQQLLWICVPQGSHAQVSPNWEGPGPGTGLSVCLKPNTGGIHTVYMYIISTNRLIFLTSSRGDRDEAIGAVSSCMNDVPCLCCFVCPAVDTSTELQEGCPCVCLLGIPAQLCYHQDLATCCCSSFSLTGLWVQ